MVLLGIFQIEKVMFWGLKVFQNFQGLLKQLKSFRGKLNLFRKVLPEIWVGFVLQKSFFKFTKVSKKKNFNKNRKALTLNQTEANFL